MPEGNIDETMPAAYVDPELDETAEEEDERDRRRFWPAYLLLLLILIIAFWIYFMRTAPVPDLIGMTEREARAALENVELDTGDVGRTTDMTVDPGEVALQDPVAGFRILKGSQVDFSINEGGEGQGKTDDGAGPATAYDGFLPDDWDKEGAPPDKIPPYTPKGKVTVAFVPEVLGKSQASAVSILKSKGYAVVVKKGPSTTNIGPGLVYFQNPPATTLAKDADTVIIWVSTGHPSGGFPYPQPYPDVNNPL